MKQGYEDALKNELEWRVHIEDALKAFSNSRESRKKTPYALIGTKLKQENIKNI